MGKCITKQEIKGTPSLLVGIEIKLYKRSSTFVFTVSNQFFGIGQRVCKEENNALENNALENNALEELHLNPKGEL